MTRAKEMRDLPLAIDVTASGNVGIGGTANEYSNYTTLTINHNTSGGILDIERNGNLVGELYTLSATDFGIQTGQATGAMRFRTNAGEVLTLLHTGNVGIGSNNPGADLDIHNSNGATLFMDDTNGRSLNLRTANNSTQYSNISSYAGLYLGGSDNANHVVIESGGDVGIGTNNPFYRLQIDQGTTATYATSFRNTADNLQLVVGTTTGGLINIQGKTINNGAAQKIALQSEGGNVGIGTANPAGILHLHGTGDLLRMTSTNSGAGGAQIDMLHFSASPADEDIMGFINMGGYYSGSNSAYFSSIRTIATDISAKQGRLEFLTRNDSTFDTSMTIDHTGNVGIGTNAPSTTDSGYNYGALHVHNASGSGAQVRWTNSTTGTGTSDGFMISKWSDKNTYMTNFDNGADTVFTQSNSSGTLVTTMTLDGDGDVGIGTTPYTGARLTLGGTDSGGYPAVLQFDNNNSSGSEFFMLATDTNWAAGSNKFIMGHGSPASSNADVTIDGSGNVGIGTTSPRAPLDIVHPALGAEPFCGLRINNTSGSGYYYTGVEVNAVGQSHYRYSLAGSLKWQTRVGLGNGTDKWSIYSWTHGDDMFVIDNSGRMHAKSLSIGASPNSPPTSGLYSSGDGIIISAGTGVGFNGGAGVGTHLEMGTNSDGGWASQYVQRYNYGGGGSNDDRMFQFTVNTSAQGYIRSTTSGTTYQGSSDYRIKKNIVNLSNTDGIIKQLRPVEFESTTEEGTDFDGVKHVGFLAHEVQEAGVTDCVSGTKDQVDEDGEPVIQGMDYGRLTPYLVKSLQDALTKIDELETRIKTLES